MAPRLIGIDWGTSSLRAYLLGDGGTPIERRARPWGVMSAAAGDFAAALQAMCGDWDAAFPALPALAAGMIGSTEGWVRAPYCPCPAGPAELAARLVPIPAARAGSLHVVPGVEQRGAAPDVMRGEETQIAGACDLDPELATRATLVLPGTHAKWASIRAGRIERFTTYLTGELYALLRDHSILGRPARAAAGEAAASDALQAQAAFERGVRIAREAPSGVTATLFRTRSLVLNGELRAADSAAFLSGVLVGEELRSGLKSADTTRLALVGDPALCARYAQALSIFGIEDVTQVDESAPAGLWRIACAAGLIPASDAVRATP